MQINFHSLDASQSQDFDAIFPTCDPIYILVNNAGAITCGTIQEVDEDTWCCGWELKVFGYINNFRRAYKRIKQRGFWVIINVIGTGGKSPVATYAAGAGGNAVLTSLTRASGESSVEDSIRVVGINPSPITTDRLES